MIFTDRKITVRKDKATIDEPVILYRGDYEVSIKFTIMESKFRFKSGVNLVDSEKASHGQLAILTPYGDSVISEIVKCEDGTVTFTLSKEMIDQLEEVGLYSFQIRLFDYYRESRVSIPPVEFGIEVREPVASEDHNNIVGDGIVGYAIAKYPISKVTDGLNEDVPDTFDVDGNYNKTDWETGDRISEGKLNKIEDAIYKINQNEINDKNALNKQMTSNFNVLQNQIDNMVIESGNTDVEVAQARGEYNSLNQRLNAMDETDAELGAQLAHIEKLVYPTMTQSEIQSILTQGGNIRFTSGAYQLDLETTGTGFTLISNTNISFDDGVVIQMSASSRDGYQLFLLSDIENVTMTGYSTIIGDKDIHTGTTGEWGHCFKIEGCKNITLEKITIKKFWGDGIYLGESANSQNENIIFNNIINEKNRRQGISVITCDGLTINDCVCKGIKGINPQAGIDIEPNNEGNIIKNVNINNLRTYNCAGSGLCISIARIKQGSDVSITVNNHYDYRSTNSLLVFNNATELMSGLIVVNDSYYDMQGINNCINIVATSSLSPKLLINRPRIYVSSSVENTTASPSKNAIGIWQPYESNELMGNVDIVEPYLFGSGRIEGYIYVRNDLHRENVEKIHIIKPRKQLVAGATSINLQIPIYANDIFVDLDTNDFNLTINYDCALSNHMQRKYILSESATANRSVDLGLAPYGYECELQNDSPTWKLTGSSGTKFSVIVPPGGYAKLKHKGKGEWEVLHKNFDLPVSYDGPHIVVITKSEYDSLGTTDDNTLYFIKEG